MRIHTRLLLFLLVSIAFYALAVSGMRRAGERVSEGVLDTQLAEAAGHFDTVLGMERAPIERAVFDNTFWDEMVRFVRHPDPGWAKENLAEAFPVFGIRDAWVFDPTLREVYAIRADDEGASRRPDIEQVRRATARDPFARFYRRLPDGTVMEYFSAPIQPSEDSARRTVPRGWLVAARPLDAAYLQRLAAATGAQVRLAPVEGAVPLNRVDVATSSIELFAGLRDADHAPVAMLEARRENLGLPVLNQALAASNHLYLLFASANLLLLAVFVIVWVRNPLQRLAESLDRHDIGPVRRYLDARHELGTMARLIRSFLDQREALLSEIEMRRQSEQALREARDLATRSARAKTDFLSVMSHELRTPLNAVIGYADILLDEQPRADQQESLHALRFAAEALLTQVNDVLDFNRIEAGKIELERRELDPRALVEMLLRTFRPQAAAADLSLHAELAADLPRVVGDPLRLAQILTNLISNAIKFTPAGGVTVAVDAAPVDGQQARLTFRVTDTGIGIPADKQQAIFEVFMQADADTTRRYGGSGLGLTIAQRLAGLMGAVITVDSQPGHGATFRFSLTLPIADAIRPAAERPRGDLAGHTVLVVDDNVVNRQLAVRMLADWGCDVETAENGVAAVACAASRRFDLILMDIFMPELNGIDAAARIREMPDGLNAATPIVAFTATNPEESMSADDCRRFDGWVAKPLRPALLRAVLARHVGLAPASAELI
ncbi:response regulator [bacterium]|nr:response regulator [bacterium]